MMLLPCKIATMYCLQEWMPKNSPWKDPYFQPQSDTQYFRLLFSVYHHSDSRSVTICKVNTNIERYIMADPNRTVKFIYMVILNKMIDIRSITLVYYFTHSDASRWIAMDFDDQMSQMSCQMIKWVRNCSWIELSL